MAKIKRVSTGSYIAPATEVNRAIDQINKLFASTQSTTLSKLGLDLASVGPKVVFVKKNYGNQVDVIIPGVLEITRGDNQGIYNAAVESHWEDVGNSGPANTLWNSKLTDSENNGWINLPFIGDRNYGSWISAVDNPGMGIGKELVLLETTTNRFFLIKFLSWTGNNYGGGFSYERYEILPEVNVERQSNDDSFVDVIVPGITELKRDSYGGAIYNSAVENAYDGYNNDGPLRGNLQAPKNTVWNSEYTDPVNNGFDNLNNVKGRKYGTFYEACNQQIGNYILDLPLVMHDLATGTYHTFYFTSWGSGEGDGQMSYIRRVIPLSEAIVLADGTLIDSAQSISGGGNGGGSGSFDQNLNTTDSVTFNVVNVNGVAAQTLEANSNGQVDNIKIGDDCWIGDGDMANGFVVKGQQAFNSGRIKLGNNPNAPVVGNTGNQRLNITKLDGSAVIPEYADNTAATNAGLNIGDIYRTGDLLKIRH